MGLIGTTPKAEVFRSHKQFSNAILAVLAI